MQGGHGDDEGKEVIDEGVERLREEQGDILSVA
jgi:hypothetical protein